MTICKHVEHILCKLDVKNRISAAAIVFAALAKAQNVSDLVRADKSANVIKKHEYAKRFQSFRKPL